MKNFLLLLMLIGLPVHAQKTQYNIKDFGAVGDGVTVCTKAINSAVEKCAANGGGTVNIPAGVFNSGTILMKSNVELHFEMGSTLMACDEQTEFPRQPQPAYRSQKDPGGWFALIYAEGASNIAITGFGTIDGKGATKTAVPGTMNDDRDGRPRNILFISCKQIRVEGIRMLHSGMWNQHYLDCEDVIIDRVEVYNHSNHNNDAVDIDGCRRAVISNSIFDTDDDGITLKSTGAAPTEDVTVTNCIVSSKSNAIKTGTESTGGFRNITISNCVIKPSRHAIQPDWNTTKYGISGITLAVVDGGVMEGVTINNITIEETLCPLYIRLGNRARKHTDDAPNPPVGTIRNINISNIVAYNTGNFSNSISGLPGQPVENITIDNVQFFNKGGLSIRDGWFTGVNEELLNLGGLTGGKYTADYQKVSDHEKGYPDAREWGYLPSSVFFLRHVKGLSINNMMFGSKHADPRIPIIAVDVERFRLGKSVFSSDTPKPPHFALLDNVSDFEVEKPLGWGDNSVIREVKAQQGWGDLLTTYVQKQYMPADQYFWDWGQATYLRSVANRYELGIEQEKMLQYIRRAMEVNWDKASGIHPNHVVSGFGMAFLARVTGEEKYRQKALAIYNQYIHILRATNGGISHRDDVTELWDDTVYMIGLFLLEMYKLTGDDKYLTEIAFQLKAHAEKLQDKKTGLWYHGWDNDDISTDDGCCMLGWADNPNRRNNEFWGRGNGWVAMILANTLHVMPADFAGRAELQAMFVKMMKTLAPLQDSKTGHWRQLPIHIKDKDNFLESSCTAMFAYAMTLGIRDGVLPANTFRPMIDKAYAGIEQYSLKPVDKYLTITNVCQGTCIGDKAYYYKRTVVDGTHFALGAAIMFYDQYQLLNERLLRASQ